MVKTFLSLFVIVFDFCIRMGYFGLFSVSYSVLSLFLYLFAQEWYHICIFGLLAEYDTVSRVFLSVYSKCNIVS